MVNLGKALIILFTLVAVFLASGPAAAYRGDITEITGRGICTAAGLSSMDINFDRVTPLIPGASREWNESQQKVIESFHKRGTGAWSIPVSFVYVVVALVSIIFLYIVASAIKKRR